MDRHAFLLAILWNSKRLSDMEGFCACQCHPVLSRLLFMIVERKRRSERQRRSTNSSRVTLTRVRAVPPSIFFPLLTSLRQEEEEEEEEKNERCRTDRSMDGIRTRNDSHLLLPVMTSRRSSLLASDWLRHSSMENRTPVLARARAQTRLLIRHSHRLQLTR